MTVIAAVTDPAGRRVVLDQEGCEWRRAVVDFHLEPPAVVTAFGDRKGPSGLEP
jgi:hypothetical protein